MILPQIDYLEAIMQVKATSFWDWQKHFNDEKSCLDTLIKPRWPEEFSCQRRDHQKASIYKTPLVK